MGFGAGAVWGLVRAAQAEYPGRFVLVDVDGERGFVGGFGWALLGGGGWVLGGGEEQLVVRGGEVFVPRLGGVAGSGGALVAPVRVSGRGVWMWVWGVRRVSLACGRRLRWRCELGVGQVRVGVRAGGLNFRDVLLALGVYPGEASDW